MAYTLTFGIALGASQTGLTLSAQLKDTAGSNVGAAITTGFYEVGLGNYTWTSSAIPDAHRGSVVFSSAGVVKAVGAVNPQEAEYTDVATSSRPSAAANATELLDQAAGVETGLTLRQALRGMTAALMAKLSGAATTTVVIRDVADTKARITATVDADGNRTAITRDLT